jgi:hypothetical protein
MLFGLAGVTAVSVTFCVMMSSFACSIEPLLRRLVELALFDLAGASSVCGAAWLLSSSSRLLRASRAATWDSINRFILLQATTYSVPHRRER